MRTVWLWCALLPVLCVTVPVQFLIIADPHLDPYYGRAQGYRCNTSVSAPEGQFGCDSPPVLVHAALRHAKEVVPSPAFVLVLGDLVRHYEDRMDRGPLDVMHDVVHQISETFPHFKGPGGGIVGLLGNSDMKRDYFLDVRERPNRYLHAAANAWDTVLSPWERAAFARRGGYWREVVPDVVVVVMNTIVYSVEHAPDSTGERDPLGQFAGMRRMLQRVRARNATAYIVGHIPPCVDDYRRRSMWRAPYVRRYVRMVREFHSIIGGQFFGHLHNNQVRAFPPEWGLRSPLYVFQAVSPVFANLPAFHAVTLDPACGGVTAIDTYSAALAAPLRWGLQQSNPRFLGMADLTNAAWRRLAGALRTDDGLWRAFQFHVDGRASLHPPSTPGARPSCVGQCRWDTVCLLLHFLPEDFKACQARYLPLPATPKRPAASAGALWIAGIVLLSIASLRCADFRRPASCGSEAETVPLLPHESPAEGARRTGPT